MYKDGIRAWGLVLGLVVACDVWLVRHHRPTMSRTLGHYLHRPVLGPILAGAWAGLTYHLLVLEEEVALVDPGPCTPVERPT